jgi:hypothetical protein
MHTLVITGFDPMIHGFDRLRKNASRCGFASFGTRSCGALLRIRPVISNKYLA